MSAAVGETSKPLEWLVERTSTEEGRNELGNGIKINECVLKVWIHDANKARTVWSDKERTIYQREFADMPTFVAARGKTVKIVCMTGSKETLYWANRIKDQFYHNLEFSMCIIDPTRVSIPGQLSCMTIEAIDFELGGIYSK